MPKSRTAYASIVILSLICVLCSASPAAACHATVTNEILLGDPDNPDIELSFTLSDASGVIGEEVLLGSGDSFTWGNLKLGRNYTLTQASPLPDGWALAEMTSDEQACWVDYDLENLQINFRLGWNSWDLAATFVNEYAPNNVPLPAAVWLLGSGLLIIIGFRRKIKA